LTSAFAGEVAVAEDRGMEYHLTFIGVSTLTEA